MIQSQVKLLMTGVSTQGDQHLAEVEADLKQTTLLLAEAVEKLGATFLAIHAEVLAQHELVAARLDGKHLSAEDASSLQAVRHRIAEGVGAAVTGLQFQDLVCQLIERTVQRVAGMRGALGELGNAADILDEGADVLEVAQALNGLNHALAMTSRELAGSLRKVVSQKHMECGEIELF